MDKEQARFILQSFRPDGADAKDPDFAEALAVAAEDRELGDWLSAERAQDATFAAALGDLSIPEELRDSILSVLEGEGEDESFNELLRAHASTGRPLGSDGFVESLERQLARSLKRKKPGPKPQERDRYTADLFGERERN